MWQSCPFVDDRTALRRYCLAVRSLRIAIIGGPQYDQIDASLAAFTAATGVAVEVAYRDAHMSLNRHVAESLSGGGHYDLVSTHSKYAPSQAHGLMPLDELVPNERLSEMHPSALGLCRVDGTLMCLPRNIDARLLFINRALVDDAWEPGSWADLRNTLTDLSQRIGVPGYAFPTRDSGLFGTFYELVAAFGGHLFDDEGGAHFDSPEAAAALEWLVDASSIDGMTPRSMAADGWYFDEVSAGFRAGQVAVVADWPGYYGLLAAQPGLRETTRVLRSPVGIDGRRHVYAGCHAWAIPSGATDVGLSMSLLLHLSAQETARVDATAGMVPVRLDVAMPADHPLDVARAELLRFTVADDLLTFPPLAHYPEIEDAASVALRAALVGSCSASDALASISI
ncbi:unannotated protein [freshwater metagenome]|uniref:Unannotated protein n=1 Tax=freshwater metagenome TaxID=449393 RepID=A0A6J7FE78_9ZZZZ